MAKRFMIILLLAFAIVIEGCSISIGPKSDAVKPPVKDGVIVLVRKGNTFGAFIPRNQRMNPENLKYEWYFPTDGKGTFRKSNISKCRSGNGTGTASNNHPGYLVAFGPFNIPWSGNEDGKGFFYYDHFEKEPIAASDTRICVTGETDINKINATDRKWIYKGSPDDKGIPGCCMINGK